MSNFVTACIEIEGIRPLLWHAFTNEAIPLQKQERTGVAGNDPEEWKRTVLITGQRQLYLPASYIFGMLRDGAKHTKKGRGSLQPLLVATLQVLDDPILINDRFLPETPIPDPTQSVYLDVRPVRNPTTKGRNIRYRVAAAPGWQARFNIGWDVTIVSQEQMKAVLIDAGRLCGLGNGRGGLGYGRFEVRSMEVKR